MGYSNVKKKTQWQIKKDKKDKNYLDKHNLRIINMAKTKAGIEKSENQKIRKSKHQHIDDLNLILSEIERTAKKSELKRDSNVFNYMYQAIDSMYKSLDELEDSLNLWNGDF